MSTWHCNTSWKNAKVSFTNLKYVKGPSYADMARATHWQWRQLWQLLTRLRWTASKPIRVRTRLARRRPLWSPLSYDSDLGSWYLLMTLPEGWGRVGVDDVLSLLFLLLSMLLLLRIIVCHRCMHAHYCTLRCLTLLWQFSLVCTLLSHLKLNIN